MKKFFIIFLAIIVVMVAYYKLAYPTFTYKYRMTVEVETPEGIKSGSSVIEVKTEQWPEWLAPLSGGFANDRGTSIGEAVVVDLGERGMLFAVSRGSYRGSIFPRVFDGDYRNRFESGGIPDYAKVKDFKAPVPKEIYPMLVFFEDINDPLTVMEVDPDDLATSFGQGVELKTITVESKTDPIEWKIEEILSWLPEYYGKLLDLQTVHTLDAEYPVANMLGSGAFSTKK